MIDSIQGTITLNNGVKMPMVGLGVFQVTDDQEVIDAIRYAVEAGYRSIDTAAAYNNEKAVGIGVKECGVDRKDLFITSKVWNKEQGYDKTMRAFDKTMQDLQLDYLDLYLIHWPLPKKNLYVETWKALEALYKEGRIRAIGISNFYQEWIERLLAECEIVPMVNQIEYHPYQQYPELVTYCQEKGIVVEAYAPMARGAVLKDERLTSIADKYGKTAVQLALRFALQNDVVIIPKSTHKDRIIANADIFDFNISDEDMEAIRQVNENKILCGEDPNTFYLE